MTTAVLDALRAGDDDQPEPTPLADPDAPAVMADPAAPAEPAGAPAAAPVPVGGRPTLGS